MDYLIIGGVVVGVVVVGGALMYNSLITAKNRVKNSWAQIDVQLTRRQDLIPNLIESVKGYMKHEREVLQNVTEARTALMNAGSVKEKAKANNMLSDTLKNLFAVAENYPKLRASENFMQLQEELVGTENKVAYARQHYNDTVMEFNTKIQSVPYNLLAGLFNFKEHDLFEATSEERKPVKVKF